MRKYPVVVSFGVDHPLISTAVALVLTAFFAAFIPTVFIDTSAEGFMVQRDPARALYDRFRNQFGSDSVTLVIIKADDVFTTDMLMTVRRLSQQIEEVEGVVRVESLATARRINSDSDDLQTLPLLPADIPTAAANLRALREYALQDRVMIGNLVASDARATAIIVYTDPAAGETDFNRRFVERLDSLLAAEHRPGLQLYQVGRPLLKHTYSTFILRDIVRLVPLSALVLLIALLVMFRTADAVVVPMVTVLVSIVWALGMLGLFRIPLNVVTAVIPSLLVTIGFAEDVHIVADFRARLRPGADKKAALRGAIEDTAAPIAVTTLTTVIGFASLALSDVPMLQQFGYGSALALVGNYAATMVLLPPITLLIGPSGESITFERRWVDACCRPLFEALGWFNVRHRVAIVIVAIGVLIAGAVATFRIDVNTDFFSYFPDDTPVRVRARDAHRVLTGTEMFWIVVDTHRPDGVLDPDQLERMASLQRQLAATGRIDKTISVADYVMTVNRQLRGGGHAAERIPESRAEVAQLLLFVPARDLSPLLNADSSAAAILVRHNILGSAPLSQLQRDIDRMVASTFSGGTAVNYTGEAILTNNAADYMAVNELTSFAFTFIAIAIVHSLLFMSVKIGLLSLIPDLIPIAIIYGLMSIAGVPLSTGTALIATIAIGISVDDTVHHLMAYAHELDSYTMPSLAMFATLRRVGRPIITASFALAAGFLVLMASNLIPLYQFGLFSALTMLLALATELVVTPALMMSIRVVTVWDMVLLKIDPERLRTSPCFRDFSEWQLRKVVLLGVLKSYPAGARAANRGEPGRLLLLVSGRFTLASAGDASGRTPWVVEAGDVIGETNDVVTWSADLVADVPSEVLLIDFESLERLRRRFPSTAAKLFRNVAGILSARLSSYSA